MAFKCNQMSLITQDDYMHVHTYIRMHAHNLLIRKYSGLLGIPAPSLLIAVTVTVMLSSNTPSGSDGAVNVSVVVGLVTFCTVPL